MTDLVHISVSAAAVTALLGYLVVFFGLMLLMLVLMLMGRLMYHEVPKAARTTAWDTSPKRTN